MTLCDRLSKDTRKEIGKADEDTVHVDNVEVKCNLLLGRGRDGGAASTGTIEWPDSPRLF